MKYIHCTIDVLEGSPRERSLGLFLSENVNVNICAFEIKLFPTQATDSILVDVAVSPLDWRDLYHGLDVEGSDYVL